MVAVSTRSLCGPSATAVAPASFIIFNSLSVKSPSGPIIISPLDSFLSVLNALMIGVPSAVATKASFVRATVIRPGALFLHTLRPKETNRRRQKEEGRGNRRPSKLCRPLRDQREDEEGIEEGKRKRKGRGTPNRLWRLWPTERENWRKRRRCRWLRKKRTTYFRWDSFSPFYFTSAFGGPNEQK